MSRERTADSRVAAYFRFTDHGDPSSGLRRRRCGTVGFLSVRTVETHRAHIQQKLNLSSRAELVAYALKRGLIKGS